MESVWVREAFESVIKTFLIIFLWNFFLEGYIRNRLLYVLMIIMIITFMITNKEINQ